MKPRVIAVASAATLASAAHADDGRLKTLQGTWVMDSAYEIHPDGTRTTNYGEHPKGLLTVDAAGRYNMQIFKVNRPAFATNIAPLSPGRARTLAR